MGVETMEEADCCWRLKSGYHGEQSRAAKVLHVTLSALLAYTDTIELATVILK